MLLVSERTLLEFAQLCRLQYYYYLTRGLGDALAGVRLPDVCAVLPCIDQYERFGQT